MKGIQYAPNITPMDNSVVVHDNVIYFDDRCVVEGWPEMKSGPTKVYQLDPDCPEDLRADYGVEYNPVPKFKKGNTVAFKGFPGISEKPRKIAKVDGDTLTFEGPLEDVPF